MKLRKIICFVILIIFSIDYIVYASSLSLRRQYNLNKPSDPSVYREYKTKYKNSKVPSNLKLDLKLKKNRYKPKEFLNTYNLTKLHTSGKTLILVFCNINSYTI